MVGGSLNQITAESVGPNIAVIGVGGAGGNAVDNMLRLNLEGVDFIVCNTDAQALQQSLCQKEKRIKLGFGVTKGLGAGSSPDVGRLAAEESIEDVMKQIEGVHMLFVTAGMGGGTGTGGAPVIASAARKHGILTVGVVTKPFYFEGQQRMTAAETGIEKMKGSVDTLLIIPNQNLFRLANDSTTFARAFEMADEVLYSAVRTFTDLMIKPGLVNLDFADICSVMRSPDPELLGGSAMMGTGEASGDDRAVNAAKMAIACPLIEPTSLEGASVLVNITGGPDLTLYDVDEAAGYVKQELGVDANIIFGATFDDSLQGSIRVSVVAKSSKKNEEAYFANAKSSLTGAGQTVSYDQKESSGVDSAALDSEFEYDKNYDQVGSRHGNFSFEDQPFSSQFSLQEDDVEFGDDSRTHDRQDAREYDSLIGGSPKKPSFMNRLASMGRGHFFKKRISSISGSTGKKDAFSHDQRSLFEPSSDSLAHENHVAGALSTDRSEKSQSVGIPGGESNIFKDSASPLASITRGRPEASGHQHSELSIPAFLRHNSKKR
ncbi:cell division protein FtsZ [Candidatus Hydrogenosomobacter endosymbioticus]|uniref:Cell division protein FtsZ n=1 Tax=Candidatus Hydrogenosomobacter endosymbioticus TaxID=2558174 RepID=A0ABM7V986_9PROT|nr:cell division protein FtsZ [Candidatus Hydrogenosomobacter endosymbioticus]BDB96036.1 hypothetical protein HYD_1690 [Candidatus Hydrogenosomobacter endosymbioticus]